MKLRTIGRQLDERGVSPVIGVILMVAITVILAAVIGTFVLGLGGQVSDTAPQASISISDASANGNVTISHDGGDAFEPSQVAVYVNGSKTIGNLSKKIGTSSIQPGQSFEVTVGSGNGQNIKLVHKPSGQLLAQAKLDVS